MERSDEEGILMINEVPSLRVIVIIAVLVIFGTCELAENKSASKQGMRLANESPPDIEHLDACTVNSACIASNIPELENSCPTSSRTENRFWLLSDEGAHYLLIWLAPTKTEPPNGAVYSFTKRARSASQDLQMHGFFCKELGHYVMHEACALHDSVSFNWLSIVAGLSSLEESPDAYYEKGVNSPYFLFVETCEDHNYTSVSFRSKGDFGQAEIRTAYAVVGYILWIAEGKSSQLCD